VWFVVGRRNTLLVDDSSVALALLLLIFTRG
jgi:hypothetical protein